MSIIMPVGNTSLRWPVDVWVITVPPGQAATATSVQDAPAKLSKTTAVHQREDSMPARSVGASR